MDNKVRDIPSANEFFKIDYVKQNQPRTMISRHFHDHFELFYLLSGERIYFINDRTYTIKSGDIIMINPFELHKTVNQGEQNYERILISFEYEFFKELESFLGGIDLISCFKRDLLRAKPEDKTIIEMILFKMLQEQKSAKDTSLQHSKLLIGELLLILTDMCKEDENPSHSYPSGMHEKISEIIQYINKNYQNKITLKDISDKFFISQFYFCRNFKAITGLTFTQYISFVRTKEAQNLLRNSNMKVTKISDLIGFENPSHFGRVFKSMTGMSPLKYRNSLQIHGKDNTGHQT